MSALTERKVRFKLRVAHWSEKLRVRPTEVRIQEMRRKWASCSAAGRLFFSLDLLGKTQSFQDFVIVHELLHLKIPNHGRLFKSLLRAHLGHSTVDRFYS